MVGETGDNSTFGQRFGALVREAREARHWSLDALAAAVYGPKKDRKGDVSKLETGKTPNPRYSTVRAYTSALGLTDAQIEACRPPKAPAPSPEVTHELRLSTELLKTLAWDFGHDNPRASVADYETFLRDKAGELRALQSRIEAMGAAEGRIANLMGAAEAALEAGDFPEADRLLADAEEIQQTEHTLVQVRKQADIRAARGDAALLNNDANTAFERFAAAASMFDAFDAIEGAARRIIYADRLCEHGLRFGGNALRFSIDLANENILRSGGKIKTGLWIQTNIQLGKAKLEYGRQEEKLKFIDESIGHLECAAALINIDNHPTDYAKVWSMIAKSAFEKVDHRLLTRVAIAAMVIKASATRVSCS